MLILTGALGYLKMNKKTAVIDIGTNTTLLLIAEPLGNGEVNVLHDEARVVRLGEGIHKHSSFLEEAMERTLKAIEEFKSKVDYFKCEDVFVMGTAACRHADNVDVFAKRLKDRTGFELNVISGDEEALYIYHASKKDFPFVTSPTLVLDIGGGSTEFIIENEDKGVLEKSLSFGTVKLTEQFIESDPPLDTELIAMQEYLQKELKQIGFSKKISHFIATAGTPTALSAIQQGMISYHSERVHGSMLSRVQIEKLIDDLKSKTILEKQQIPVLDPKRADVILTGAVILLEVMKFFDIHRTLVSDRGLRFGVLYKKLGIQ